MFKRNSIFEEREKVFLLVDSLDITSCKKENPVLEAWILNNFLHLLVTMTEQQGTPDQLPAEKDQGGAGATYKVQFCLLQSKKLEYEQAQQKSHHPILHFVNRWPFLSLRIFVEQR